MGNRNEFILVNDGIQTPNFVNQTLGNSRFYATLDTGVIKANDFTASMVIGSAKFQ
jgi:hypothetical protein